MGGTETRAVSHNALFSCSKCVQEEERRTASCVAGLGLRVATSPRPGGPWWRTGGEDGLHVKLIAAMLPAPCICTSSWRARSREVCR